MSSHDKPRASTSGKASSFFSRAKHKVDKRNTSDEGRFLAPDYEPSSTVTSRSSRHPRDSVVSISDRPNSADGLNMTAGVMTTIPCPYISSPLFPLSVCFGSSRGSHGSRDSRDKEDHPLIRQILTPILE